SGLAAFVISLDCRLLDCFLLGGLLLAHRFGGFGLAFARAFILAFYGLVLGVNCLVTGFGGFLVLGFSRLIRGFGSFLVLGFSSLGLGFGGGRCCRAFFGLGPRHGLLLGGLFRRSL